MTRLAIEVGPRKRALLAGIVILAGCSTPGPTDPPRQLDAPDPDPGPTYTARFGIPIAGGVRGDRHPLYNPGWVFLGNSSEIAYVTYTGGVGGGTVWYRDLDATDSARAILSGLNNVQEIRYASGPDRVFVGQWPDVQAVSPDGSNPVTLATDNAGPINVSTDGRFLLRQRQSDGVVELIDSVSGAASIVDVPFSGLRMFDDFAVYPTEARGGSQRLEVLDLVTLAVDTTAGLPGSIGSQHYVSVGGDRSAPEWTVIDKEDAPRVVTFTGDTGTGGGTIVSNFDVPEPIFEKEALRGAASPDGNRFAVSILRGFGWWEIVYFDEQSGVTRVVASWLTPMPVGLTFSPDGTRLLYGASGTLFLVELDP